MSVTVGFYRHYKGHVYYVHGVGTDHHRVYQPHVVHYSSVKSAHLSRDLQEFEQWVYEDTGETYYDEYEHQGPLGRYRAKCGRIVVPRFLRINDPALSIVPASEVLA